MARSDFGKILADIPLFSECSAKDRKSILGLMTSSTVPAGEELATQGKSGREFVIIERGTAVVRRNGRKIATMGPGDCFGELAMLIGGTRTATVIAETDMSIWVLGPTEFSSLMKKNSSIMYNVLIGAVKRLYEDNQRAVQ